MSYPFDESCRRQVAERCAAFCRAEQEAPVGLKRAAVAIAVCEAAGGDAGFLLTRRAATLRAHGNQWALPGGRCDEGETLVETALRELHEELGLRLDAQAALGVLDDYPTRSGYLITPVVVWAGACAELQPNPAEVASVHRIPLAEIMHADAVDFVASPDSHRQVVRIRIEGNHVHAPTAAVIYQFREILAGRETRVSDLEQPRFAWR